MSFVYVGFIVKVVKFVKVFLTSSQVGAHICMSNFIWGGIEFVYVTVELFDQEALFYVLICCSIHLFTIQFCVPFTWPSHLADSDNVPTDVYKVRFLDSTDVLET